MGEEIELLEDHAHFSPHGIDVGSFSLQVDAVNIDVPGRGLLQVIDAAQYGAFSGAARTHDNDDLSFLNLQANVFDSLDVAKVLMQPLHADHLLSHD